MSDALVNPFPGLRSYREDERHLFFGRTEPANELIRRLGDSRFLAVVGTSGSGKSSLVRCGVLPALHGGFLSKAGSSWRVAILGPGNQPIDNLARALAEAGISALGTPGVADPAEATFVETVLRRGALGAVEAVRYARLEPDENVLIVVDQFEELFRFKSSMVAERPEDEAAAFVKLLVEAARADARIYVMLTMRSDYLGLCTEFHDLPDAINDGLYLIPRMTRSQQRQTIEGPVAMGGATIAPRLVQQLLNDLGDDPDQLPILQHALMRTWSRWSGESRPAEPIDLDHYRAIGGMADAMDQHAEEVMRELGPSRETLVERIFQALTETADGGRVIRRPTTLDTLCDVVESSRDRVEEVIEAFRLPGRAFLMPPAGEALQSSSPLDISHESLIRIWRKLGKWVESEGNDAAEYRRLSDRARADLAGGTNPPANWLARLVRSLPFVATADRYTGSPLRQAVDWQKKRRPTAAWADRYDDDFDIAIRLLDQSKAAAQALKGLGVLAVVAVLVTSVVAAYRAAAARDTAERARTIAVASSRSDPLEGALVLTELQGRPDVEGRGLRVANDLVRQLIPRALWRDPQGTPTTWAEFDPGGRRVLVLTDRDGLDPVARILDAETGVMLRSLSPGVGTKAATFRPNGDVTWFSTDGWLRTGDPDSVAVAADSTLSVIAKRSIRIPGGGSQGFSDDGSLFVVVGDSTVRVRDVEHPDSSMAFRQVGVVWWDFNRQSSRLASWSVGDSLKIHSLDWTTREARELHSYGGAALSPAYAGALPPLVFSPSGEHIATLDPDGVLLWAAGEGADAPPDTLPAPARPTAARFDVSGRHLIVASDDGAATIWDLERRGPPLMVLSGHDGALTHAAFSPTGRFVVTASRDSTVRVWGSENGRPLYVLRGHRESILGGTVRFSQDESKLVSSDSAGVVRLWQIDPPPWLLTVRAESALRTAALSPRPVDIGSTSVRLLATGGADGLVHLWDARTGDSVGSPMRHPGPVTALAWSPDGSRLVAASDSAAWVWTVIQRDRLVPPTADTLRHATQVSSVAVSPDGRLVLTGSWDRTARLWDAATGDSVETPLEHADQVHAARFAADGSVVTGSATEGFLAVVRLWDAQGAAIRDFVAPGAFSYMTAAALSPNGQRVVAASQQRALVWELSDSVGAEPRYSLDAGSEIASIAFVSDSLVFVAEKGSAEVPASITAWNPATGDRRYRLGDHTGLLAMDIAPDGSSLVTASADSTARVWPMRWDDLLYAIRERATSACLTVPQRMDLLGESRDEADEKLHACRSERQTANRKREP